MVIINAGLGNFNSVLSIIRKCGSDVLLTNSYEDVKYSKKIILLGIGSFDNAILKLKNDPYNLNNLKEDREYFLKKMDWTEKDLQSYLSKPTTKHDYYKSENKQWIYLTTIYKYLFNV